MNKLKQTTLVLMFLLNVATILQAANPLTTYFARLLDETRAEDAIGNLLFEQFVADLPDTISLASDSLITNRMQELVQHTPRPDMRLEVLIIQSDIIDEIPLPGNRLLITSGLLRAAVSEEQLDFILARNLAHFILKHPMKLIKNEGLYPALLNQLKLSADKRNTQQIRALLGSYLHNLIKMNHKKADLQGILLTKSPENTRKSAISMLSTFAVRVWPVTSWDTGGLPARIADLEKLKLPE